MDQNVTPIAEAVVAAGRWFFRPIARGRVAVLRTLVYSFIFVDVLLTASWVARHAYVPGDLYDPLFVGRVLPLPTPTPLVVGVTQVALLVAAAIGATGRLPRLVGAAVFLLYAEWMFIAMSYGKVDHDRFAFLVALAVLPTVGAARWGDRERDEATGWAIRAIQVAVVLTYFLSTFAKLRFGGIEWLNGATLLRAVMRRGTDLADPLAENPWVLHAAQYALVCFELATPLLLIEGRIRTIFLGLAFAFHVLTYATIGIIFLPHVICLAAFLPLETIRVPALASRFQARREIAHPKASGP